MLSQMLPEISAKAVIQEFASKSILHLIELVLYFAYVIPVAIVLLWYVGTILWYTTTQTESPIVFCDEQTCNYGVLTVETWIIIHCVTLWTSASIELRPVKHALNCFTSMISSVLSRRSVSLRLGNHPEQTEHAILRPKWFQGFRYLLKGFNVGWFSLGWCVWLSIPTKMMENSYILALLITDAALYGFKFILTLLLVEFGCSGKTVLSIGVKQRHKTLELLKQQQQYLSWPATLLVQRQPLVRFFHNMPCFDVTFPLISETEQQPKFCGLCFSKFQSHVRVTRFLCGHEYHLECNELWQEIELSCADCRLNDQHPGFPENLIQRFRTHNNASITAFSYEQVQFMVDGKWSEYLYANLLKRNSLSINEQNEFSAQETERHENNVVDLSLSCQNVVVVVV
jgi:hypothetical protein